MEATELIELIRTSEKKTPVRVVLQANAPCEFPGAEVFSGGNGLHILYGDWKTLGPQLTAQAALTLQLHGVEDLVLHLALVHGVALLEQAVCQRGFAVVDVRDNGKIPDMVQIGHGATSYFMNLSMAAHRLAMA